MLINLYPHYQLLRFRQDEFLYRLTYALAVDSIFHFYGSQTMAGISLATSVLLYRLCALGREEERLSFLRYYYTFTILDVSSRFTKQRSQFRPGTPTWRYPLCPSSNVVSWSRPLRIQKVQQYHPTKSFYHSLEFFSYFTY